MATLIQDLRFALRSFVRAPRFTIPAILALALGIGATSATLSIVRGVMLEPLPYRDAGSRRHGLGDQCGPEHWSQRHWSCQLRRLAGAEPLVREPLDGRPGPTELDDGQFAPGGRRLLCVLRSVSRDWVSCRRLAARTTCARTSGQRPGHDRQPRLLADAARRTIRYHRHHDQANGRPRTVVGVMPEGFTLVGQKAAFLIPYGWTWNGFAQHRAAGRPMGSRGSATA